MEVETARELFFGVSYVELLTIVAIVVGPILAVIVTRFQGKHETRLQRKLDVFRSLMKTRKFTLDHEHVGALNLIEMEFYGKKSVIDSYRKYIEFRHEPLPSNENDDQERHFKRGENLLYDLLHEIGATLGYHFDKDDLKRFSYSPKGWGDDEFLNRKNARLLSRLLEGNISLPITAMPPQQQNLFPPAPHQLDDAE